MTAFWARGPAHHRPFELKAQAFTAKALTQRRKEARSAQRTANAFSETLFFAAFALLCVFA
jgi:hypothetical protein